MPTRIFDFKSSIESYASGLGVESIETSRLTVSNSLGVKAGKR